MSRHPSPFRASCLTPNREDTGTLTPTIPHSSPADPSEICHIIADVDDALHHLCTGLVQFAHILDKLRQRGGAQTQQHASTSAHLLSTTTPQYRQHHQSRLMTVVCTTNQKFWSERRHQLQIKLEHAQQHEAQQHEGQGAAVTDAVAMAIASIGHQFEDLLEDAKDIIRPPIPLSQKPSIAHK